MLEEWLCDLRMRLRNIAQTVETSANKFWWKSKFLKIHLKLYQTLFSQTYIKFKLPQQGWSNGPKLLDWTLR